VLKATFYLSLATQEIEGWLWLFISLFYLVFLSCLLILLSISCLFALLASCAQLASYLCLLIYVTLSISCYANKGEIEGEKASTRQPFLSHLRC
jgi:hypothetical protein